MTLTQINKAGLDEIALDHVFTIGASGSSAYTFQGEGLNGTVNNPTLYLTRGKTYRFENGSGGHPIRIQSTSGASGTAYNTGVTNNAGSGTVIVEVQHDAPDVLYYQCTSHSSMNGILYITGALPDGGVTTAKIATGAVTTEKINDNAVTSAKIPADAIGNSEIAPNAISGTEMQNNSISTGHIVDEAVTLAKLPHGTSSNDGKFLRANNGADPSFETVTSTTINNNANDRVITGSGTANTLNAESSVQINSDGRMMVNGTYGAAQFNVTGESALGLDAKRQFLGINSHNDDMQIRATYYSGGASGGAYPDIKFVTTDSERLRITAGGKVGIGISNPYNNLDVSGSVSATGNQLNTAYADGVYIGTQSGNAAITAGKANTSTFLPLVFRQDNQASGTERMRIDSSGSVRIANTTFTANTSADDLIVGSTNSGINRGITILNHSGADGRICFADANDDDRGMIKYVHASDIMQFFVNGSEKVHINSSGFIKGRGNLANLQSPTQTYHELNADTAHNITLLMKHGSSNGYGVMQMFNHGQSGIYAHRVHNYASGSDNMFIRTDGDLENINSSYGGISDVKLKENIVDAPSQWDDIKGLRVRNFNFIADTDKKKLLGLVAQEAETVCPSLVKTVPDLSAENEDLGTTTKVLKYSILYMKAIKALQEAQTRIETLETKVTALEAA